jgi:hypothetical protein
MKKSFEDYFNGMGLDSQESRDRLFTAYHAAARLLPGEIDNVFISQFNPAKAMSTRLDSLWVFSGARALEAREFMNRDDFLLVDLRGIQSLRVAPDHFDLQSLAPAASGPNPSLVVEFTLSRDGLCRFHASGANCAKLSEILLENLKPGLWAL